jgi:hypothetical protein
MSLFDGKDFIALSFQLTDSLKSCRIIAPGDTVLCAKGSLVNLCAGRRGGDATETNTLYSEGIACTEDAADIMHRSHIVEHHH